MATAAAHALKRSSVLEESLSTSQPTENGSCSKSPSVTRTFIAAMTAYTFSEVFPDKEAALDVCTNMCLLPDRNATPPPLCPKCHGPMCSKPSTVNQAGFIYRCRKIARSRAQGSPPIKKRKEDASPCFGSVSPMQNTFFEGVKISVLKVMRLMHAWVIRLPVTTAAIESHVSHKTAVDFYRFFREVALIHVSHMQVKIGGPGKTVQVGDTFTCKKKYHQGRVTEIHKLRIFGIYCQETKEGLFWHVPNKSRAVLWTYMYEFIQPGTTVVSDAAPQYTGCEQLGFAEHRTINHSVRGPGRFVSTMDPKVHTQNIKIRNRYLKDTIRSAKDGQTLQQYIAEYTYRERRFRNQRCSGEMLATFMEDVAAVYPGPGLEGLAMKDIGVDVLSPTDGPYITVQHTEDNEQNFQASDEEALME